MKLSNYATALLVAAAVASPVTHAASTNQPAESTKAAQNPAWKHLEAAKWIRDGRETAPRIVYAFSDPNCIWCHRFWEAARPWVDAGEVQVRHILVGIIKANSPGKAAAILTAQDPAAALAQHEKTSRQGGIKELETTPDAVNRSLKDNLRLMHDFGFRGTPAIVYIDAHGEINGVSGFPGERMDAVMGSPTPKK